MATTITWKIDSMECKKQEEGFTDIVYNVHWRVNGTDDVHYTSVYGSQILTYDLTDPDYDFIAYEDLDEATVIGWLQDAMGAEQVTALEDNVENQLAQLANPPTEVKPLPWGFVPQPSI